nr:MAG TPA: hypothetical protein [Bacteriophage sp.]
MINVYFPCRINIANLCSLINFSPYSYFTILINLYIVSRTAISKCKVIKVCSI